MATGDRLRPVEDLVRIRIADTAEQAWVGERPFEGVVPATKCRAEGVQIRLEDFEPAGIVGLQGRCPFDQVERRPLLRAGLGQDQGTAIEIEGREVALTRDARAGVLPMEAPRDHEMEYQPHVVLEADGNAFTEATQLGNLLGRSRRERRRHGTQQERTREPNARERLADDSRPQRLDVNGDVGQLGHGEASMARLSGIENSLDTAQEPVTA